MLRWGRIWSDTYDSDYKIVRVKKEFTLTEQGYVPVTVANAFEPRIWLRRRVSDELEEGVYNIKYNGGLERTENQRVNYPDLSLKMPDFSLLSTAITFNDETLVQFSTYIDRLMETNINQVTITQNGFFGIKPWDDVIARDENSFLIPTSVPLNPITEDDWENMLVFEVRSVRYAIDEISNYQGQEIRLLVNDDYCLAMSEEHSAIHRNRRTSGLMVIGVEANSCAIISDTRSKL